jgi:hypothetical protein
MHEFGRKRSTSYRTSVGFGTFQTIKSFDQWLPMDLQRRARGSVSERKSRLGESGQNDKWLFCLTAAMIAAHQERL